MARRRIGLGVAVLGEQRHRVRAGERRAPAEQLPQRGAERVEVGLRERRGARALLGRLVVGRPGRAAGGLERVAGGHRDAEVAEAGAAVGAEPDVVGLDVAVDDPVRVRMGERVGERAAGLQHLGGREPAVRERDEPLRQRPAGHEARDDVQPTRVLDGVEDGDDVRVVAEPRHQARLAAHPLARLLAGRPGPRTGDRDRPLERQVVREPDLLRPAAAEQPLGAVAPGDQRGVGGVGYDGLGQLVAEGWSGGGIVGHRRRDQV